MSCIGCGCACVVCYKSEAGQLIQRLTDEVKNLQKCNVEMSQLLSQVLVTRDDMERELADTKRKLKEQSRRLNLLMHRVDPETLEP
jgi:hypothetical protein